MPKHLRIGGPPLGLIGNYGQSNDGAAFGNAAQAPAVPAGQGLEYVHATRSFKPLVEPVDAARWSGSHCSAFAIEWARTHDEQIVFHPYARSGAVQQVAASTSGHWTPSGPNTPSPNHYLACVAELDHAIADLDARPEPWRLLAIWWGQGGSDALQIDSQVPPGATKQGYKDSFAEMAAAFRARYRADLPIFINRLGKQKNIALTQGWLDVRSGQDEIVAADPYTHFAFTAADAFDPAGMADNVHYSQPSLNTVGTESAKAMRTLLG